MAAIPQKEVLTPKGLDALKPAEAGKRYVVYDALMPHLGVRVTANGVKSFIVYKRPAGAVAPVIVTLGRYPAMKLAKARELAPGVLGTLAEGKLPADVEAERRREEARRRADTIATAVEKFIEYEEGKGLRTWRETEGILRREFLGQEAKRRRVTSERGGKTETEWVTEWAQGPEPVWSARPILSITRRDVIERLDAIKARGGKHAARHALSAVRKFFNWAEEGERFGVEESPAARVRDKTLGISGRDLKRQRVLNDPELRDVWSAADAMGYPFGRLVQLLMLNGQRLNDNARARRSEIDLEAAVLSVPPERYKTGVAQEVPISPRAAKILDELPKFKGDFVFTTTGGVRPISGLSKMKVRLDKAIAERREKAGAAPMAHWTLHDLRRTVRTRLVSDCGVDAFTAERVLGHALPGLHGVYDQGTHRDQKRAALEKWEARLLAIVEPKPTAPKKKKLPANVVQFEKAQAHPARRQA